ncbi:MAG: DNA polymerase Y family protein [Proteobacteria bacterium]|nr:DNA polymerase Y family protein [Pseudomonadota bacterium]
MPRLLPSMSPHAAATPAAMRAIGDVRSAVRTLPASALWLHVHLPQLPLEVLTRGMAQHRACVLVQGEGSRRKVLMANTRAATLGIRAGMPLGAAHALGDIVELERNARAEQQALENLGVWAMHMTPLVSLAPPDGVLLEVRGSLGLFHGLDGLLARLRQGLKQLGYRAQYAVAPTPLAATLLARGSNRTVVQDEHELGRHLGGLPLEVLRLSPAEQEALQSIGVRTLGECRRLSRADLARRLSPALLDTFDRLYGQARDPRVAMPAPEVFDAAVELPWEVRNAQALVTAGERLLLQLQGYLRARIAMTRRLRWRLANGARDEERFDIHLTQPTRDHDHMLLLLRETLMRMTLKAPVTAMELKVDELVSGNPVIGADLFGVRHHAQGEAYANFIDRLRSRCGSEALRAMELQPDHRPEAAWRWRESDEPVRRGGTKTLFSDGLNTRPVWLVREPVTLSTQHGIPQFDGPLRLVPARERIDTGWWDERGLARDYFIARTTRGSRLWVYKELDGEQRWRLHGVFE